MEDDMLDIEEVLACICMAVEESDGDEVAQMHNSICLQQIEYVGDSLWRYTGREG